MSPVSKGQKETPDMLDIILEESPQKGLWPFAQMRSVFMLTPHQS